MRISILAAVAEGGAMDKHGEIPWHCPEDRRKFLTLTVGRAVVMDEALFKVTGVLPNRLNIVVTRKARDLSNQGIVTVRSFGEALLDAAQRGVDELFCIGGGDLCWQAMPVAEKIYLTRVDRKMKGSTFFPAIDMDVWRCVYAGGGGPYYDKGEKFFAQFLEFDRSKVIAIS